jgi:hypothetical protein
MNIPNIPTAPDMSDEKIFAQFKFIGEQFALAESSYKVIAKSLTKCQTLAQTCLALEKENPAALQATRSLLLQAIEDLKAAILAPPTDPSKCVLPPFATDDLPKLNRQLDEYLHNHISTQDILHLAYEAHKRGPKIFITLCSMEQNGITVDDLFTDILFTFNSVMAQAPQILEANPGYKSHPNPEAIAKGICALQAIRILTEKAENWIHEKARTLSPVPQILSAFKSQIQDLKSSLDETKATANAAKNAATSAQALAQSNNGKLGLIQDNYRDFKKEHKRDAKFQAEKASETNNIVKTIAAVAPSAQTLLAAARGEPQRKPSNTISLADATRIMRRVCPKHFVDERTLQRWVEKGSAAKSGLSITWANFATEDTWTAWCQEYNNSFAPPPDLLH